MMGFRDLTFVFHPATAEGEGGVAVVELYGEGAARAIERLFRPCSGKGEGPREGEVRLGDLADPSGGPIDQVLVAFLPASASWCGLPSWAISCHGGAFVQRRLRAALAQAGGREVDRRGVVALARSRGALDGPRGDALELLPGCRTARAARYLLRMAAGGLSARLEEVLRVLESEGLAAARLELQGMLRDSPAVLRLTVPRRILIAGRPNVGKSSLFNCLLGKERAVVTPIPGTTRDLLEETVEIAGYPVVFIDSAGLRPAVELEVEPVDRIEEEGMRRARTAAVDSVLFLIDRPGSPAPDEERFLAGLPPEEVLVVRSKADLWLPGAGPGSSPRPREASPISVRTGAGLEALRERIRSEWLGPPDNEEPAAAPFTPLQREALMRTGAAPSVDAAREALLECLTFRRGVR